MMNRTYMAIYVDNRKYNKGQYYAKYFGAESLREAEVLARRYESPLNGNAHLIAIRTGDEVVWYDKKIESNTKI